MTFPREQIIAWARQVGMTYLPHISEESMKQVEAHAALIEQATIERCAKACEGAEFDSDADFYRPDFAAALRALKEQV